MVAKFPAALVLVTLVTTGLFPEMGSSQEIQPQAGGPIEPKEAFVENAPLAEAGFDEAVYNAKEQRLREHYLPTPIGDLPEGRNLQEAAAEMPAETQVEEAEAAAVQIIQNRALADAEINNGTSVVCEPSLAVRGNEVLFTGNWFASFSRDGGASFQFRNPFLLFPAIPNRSFCCDQVAYYVPSHDLMVWFLQYVKDTTGNTVRLAVAHGDDIPNERWRIYDFTPQQVGNWTAEWFDYPDIAASQQFLFITTNSFSLANQFKRAVTLRLPLDQLRNYAALNFQFFDRTDVGSLKPVQGQQNVMHIGTHLNTGTLRVFAWADSGQNIQQKDFPVNAWIRGGASSPGPDGNDWLGFVDGRITGAWSIGANQGFAWTSAQGGSFPRPNVRVAILDWNAGTVIRQPHVWNSSIAFAYPAMAVNSAGRPGTTIAFGGNQLHPSNAVGTLDTDFSWKLATTVNGTNGPNLNRWGDYLTVRLNGANQARFASTAFALSQGSGNESIVPRLVQFDVQFVTPSEPPSEPPPTPSIAMATRDTAESRPTDDEPAISESVWSKALELAETQASGVGVENAAEMSDQPQASGDENELHRKFSWSQGAARARRTKEVFDIAAAASARMGIADLARVESISVIPVQPRNDLQEHQALLQLPPAAIFFYEPPESVCSPDERTQVSDTATPPWSANCQLIITFPNGARAVGSGWFLGPRLIVTAGHCVHMGEGGGFFRSVEVIPAMNGMLRPFGSQVSTEFRASEQWKTSGRQTADYGAIILPSAFTGPNGESPGTLPAVVLNDTEMEGLSLTISGYPADKPAGTQWRHSGPIDTISANRLFYTIDTAGGHSGSPATCMRDGQLHSVGIHNYGGCPNKCSRIDSQVMADLQRWLTESNSP